MKRCLAAALILLLTFARCSGETQAQYSMVSVTLIDSPFVDCPSGGYVLTARHQDVVFILVPHRNYFIASVDYPDYELLPDEDGYRLILKDVAYTTRVQIQCLEGDTVILYEPNGGELLNGTYCRERYSLIHHRRPNTSQGIDIMRREGYTLKSWNTAPDGSGERVGLGSRATVERGGSLTLYAQWQKWSPASDFVFAEEDDTVTVVSYQGADEAVAVPESVGGKPVVSITAGAFAGCRATDVLLPPSVMTVEAGAFQDCALRTLTFSDRLLRISDSSFQNCPDFSTVYINAAEPPRYASFDRHSSYADKVDNLIVNADKKKIVLFGGSGTFYSLDAGTLAAAVPGYEAFNLGINAWFPAQAQLEIILPFISEGDILLHAPEMMSEYQFLARRDMGVREGRSAQDARFFMCAELNYDLLSYVDIRHVSAFFDTYSLFSSTRQPLPRGSYSDFTTFVTARGDYEPYRFVTVEKIGSISGEGGLNIGLLSDQNLEALEAYYDDFARKGCRVLRAFAAVNADSLSEQDFAVMEDYERKYLEAGDYPCLNRLEDVMYPTTAFCDTDWHLTYENAVLNTRKLIPAILGYTGG